MKNIEWLFFLPTISFAMFLASWIPLWKIDFHKKFYTNFAVDFPFMYAPLWFGGLMWTLLFSCAYLASFFAWRELEHNDTVVFILFLAQMLVFSVWSIPYYYYKMPWWSLALLTLAALIGIAYTGIVISEGLVAAAILYSVWNAAIVVVVAANVIIGLAQLRKTARPDPMAHRLGNIFSEIVRQDFMPEPL